MCVKGRINAACVFECMYGVGGGNESPKKKGIYIQIHIYVECSCGRVLACVRSCESESVFILSIERISGVGGAGNYVSTY